MNNIKKFEHFNQNYDSQSMYIIYSNSTPVYHLTSKKNADIIKRDGFKTGYELNIAERRYAIYFSDLDVNYGIYGRNKAGEAYEGQELAEVVVDIQNLKLLNMNYKENGLFINHKLYNNFVVRGELQMLPECDGSISFLEDGRIYEVVLKKDVANSLLNMV
jgi:hypothetical protein